MLLIYEWNSRKEKRLEGVWVAELINDTVNEPKRVLDGRKHGNQWAKNKAC